jgi:hypothetical protein
MRALLLRSLFLTALFLGLGSLAPAGEESPERAAQRDILALADNLDHPDAAIMAQNIVTTHDSCSISSVFAVRERGGLGIGSLAKVHQRNSVERLVNDYARKPPSREELETHQADLDRTARTILAMSELAPHRNPYADKPDSKQSREWQRVAAEFKVKATEFRAAVNCKEPERVKKAANNLTHTCCDCHSLL